GTRSDSSRLRNATSRFDCGGGSAFQFACLDTSSTKIGITCTGGSDVSLLSPQVTSKSTSIEKNRIEIEPVPLARHGVGPSSEKRRWMLSRSSPNTSMLNDPLIIALK